MAEIRLIKLTKQFNIGLGTLVDFLKGKGFDVESNPNAKVSDDVLPLLASAFGEELKAKMEAEKTTIKFKEIIDNATRRKSDRDDDEPERELVIKNNNFSAAPAKETAVAAREAQAKETQAKEAPVKEAPAKEPPKHKGGRPKKTAEGKETVAEEAFKKKPGRPKKAAPADVKEPAVQEAPKKKSGRPKKAAAPAESKAEAPKKTTRKRKKAE